MLKEIATNKYFVLLSGRWFSSPSLDGPWTNERGDQLPASFKQIAPASPVGDALASVAGTNQAEDAEMDAEIPQTAAIKRSESRRQLRRRRAVPADSEHRSSICGEHVVVGSEDRRSLLRLRQRGVVRWLGAERTVDRC
jgi:hypothetical protein